MKQNNTEIPQQKKSTFISVAVVILLQLGYLALYAWVWGQLGNDIVGMIVIIVVAFANIATIAGVLVALRQRIKEWKGGEEHDAGQY